MKKALALFGSFLILFTAQAAIKTVIGNAGTGWSNAANWTPGGIPQTGDEVIIPAGRTISVKGTIYTVPVILQIRIAGTLDFDPSGKLNLLIGSHVQLQSSSSWITSNGTSSELITINGITKYRGSTDGNINGPRYASTLTGVSPNGFDLGVLPVKLKELTGTSQNGKVQLQWLSEIETNLGNFVVERSANGRNWEQLNSTAPKGNGSKYEFTDIHPAAGINYYRLKSVDIDGHYEYSSVLSIQAQSTITNSFRYLEPAHSILISLMPGNHPALNAQIFSIDGKLQRQQQLAGGSNTSYQLPVDGLAKGMYVVVLKDRNQFVGSSKVVIR